MKMTFGEFVARDICHLPSGYLLWLVMECADMREAAAADIELNWRRDNDAHWYGRPETWHVPNT